MTLGLTPIIANKQSYRQAMQSRKSGCEHIITFSSNLFLSEFNNWHCCASLRAIIQTCRRVHKTICEPLHGSLPSSQTSFRHHASIFATSFPVTSTSRPLKPRSNPPIHSSRSRILWEKSFLIARLIVGRTHLPAERWRSESILLWDWRLT